MAALGKGIFYGLVLSIIFIWAIPAFGIHAIWLPLALIAGHMLGKPLGRIVRENLQ